MPVALIGWAWLAACERASRDGEAESPAVCEAGLAAPPPRQLRLLTRREYDATVADLLPDAVGAGGACRRDADCDWADESCVAGTCDADPCEVVTFADQLRPEKLGGCKLDQTALNGASDDNALLNGR